MSLQFTHIEPQFEMFQGSLPYEELGNCLQVWKIISFCVGQTKTTYNCIYTPPSVFFRSDNSSTNHK